MDTTKQWKNRSGGGWLLTNKTHLFQTLEKIISGDLRTDPLSRYMLSTDGSIFRVEPAAVAYPKSSGDVVNIVKFAQKNHIAVHSRGAGSWGLAAEHFHLSRQVGRDMIEKLTASGGTIGATDCPTCRIQMAQFSDMPIRHPVEIVADFLKGEYT